MVSLLEHIQSLSKKTKYTEHEVFQCLLMENIIVMDEDSLLGFSIEETSEGRAFISRWTDGDGSKIWRWMEDKARENKCVVMYGASPRWKAICRKYKMQPVDRYNKHGRVFKKEVIY